MDEILETALVKSLDGLRFGSVEIIVHDGRITQIERRERFRPYQETGVAHENTDGSADRKSGSVSRRTEK